MTDIIDSFSGQYRFLSNFSYEGGVEPTVEHHYQAAKTRSALERAEVLEAATPGMAKKLGRKVKLRPDWESIKLDVMNELLIQKFKPIEIREKLIATGDAWLIEGNDWGDTYWGHVEGLGKNMLGKLLMAVRIYYKEITDIENDDSAE